MKIIEVVDRNDELREMDIAVSFGSTHKDQADVYNLIKKGLAIDINEID